MSPDETMYHIRNNTPLNKVRAVLSGIIGTAALAALQRRPPSPIETRAAEFEGVKRLLGEAIAQGLVTAAQADGIAGAGEGEGR